LSDSPEVFQLERGEEARPRHFDTVEDLLRDISVTDLGCRPDSVRIILSGNDEFPFDTREQWTDSCNLLALQEGVVLGYDRNDKTTEAFRQAGFDVIDVKTLIAALESGDLQTGQLTDTLVLMPSAELSRARGGFHCMSMPLLRD